MADSPQCVDYWDVTNTSSRFRLESCACNCGKVGRDYRQRLFVSVVETTGLSGTASERRVDRQPLAVFQWARLDCLGKVVVEALQLPVVAVVSTSVVVVATCVTVVVCSATLLVVGALVTAAEVSAFVVTTGAVLVAASLVTVDADVDTGSESYTHPCVNRFSSSEKRFANKPTVNLKTAAIQVSPWPIHGIALISVT